MTTGLGYWYMIKNLQHRSVDQTNKKGKKWK